ncbi:TEL2, telomere maintenance protein 2 [Dermatophagoides pteronyssinus]|uniref:TEL2, telomere maintenance protein 2 n=1 Tax=Dermatophagoides pteronyssinus TaxID=6956 RepID=A0ABQ8JNZ9_DERPT|nr:TEL2, telomere maintenance protein 2 [Dermatophagoides pteronyssinus]
MAELPNLGQHCSICSILVKFIEFLMDDSKSNDFIKCHFCSNSVQITQSSICNHCLNRFCLHHRHQVDHKCLKLDETSFQNESDSKLDSKMSNILAKIRSEYKPGITVKNRGAKNNPLALKVTLMKLKSQGIGFESIPMEEREYFYLSFIPNEISYNQESKEFRDKPIFLCKEWSIGKCVDWLAQKWSLINKNNQSDKPKLILTNEGLLINNQSKKCCEKQNNNNFICFSHSIKDLLANDNGIENDSEKYNQFYDYVVSFCSIFKFNIFIEKLLIEKEKSLRRDKIMSILIDIVFESENFENLVITIAERLQMQKYSSFEIDKFINILVSFPELIANLYGSSYPRMFETKNYISRLCHVLEQILHRIHDCDQERKSYVMHHIHCIVRRLCLRGYQEPIWNHLLKNLFDKIIEDDKWNKLAQDILFGYHREEEHTDNVQSISEMSKFLEPLFKMIFHYSSCSKSIEILFPFDFICKHVSLLSKIEFLLTNKFVLIYHCPLNVDRFNRDQFIYNLLGYLFRCNLKWFITLSNNVMDAWSNSNAFNYRKYQQQFYLCRLMILIGRLLLEYRHDYHGQDDMKKIIEKLQSSTFNGSTINLASSQQEFRSIGLTTSLILFELFIKFNSINIELPEFPELKNIENDDCEYLKYLGSFDLNQMFEISHCIEGLCDYEKSDWMRKCLQSSEKIIRTNFDRLDSVSLRFTKILFDLDDNCGIENFDQLRLNSLIALCVGSPKIVASYLTDRFYAQHISIRNRMDVLAVLTKASEELSQLKPLEFKDQDKFVKAIPENSKKLLTLSEQNRKFQQNKITNQIYFSCLSSKIFGNISSSTTTMSSNRFVPVAKYFFFPLLRDFEKMDLKLKIHEIDSFIIESLILALGIMLQNCHNHSQTMLMSKELLPFIYSYRNHLKSNVRSAIINTFSIVLQSTPAHFLINDLQNQMIDFKIWLQEIIINDLNQDCMIKAYRAMMALSELVNHPQLQSTHQSSIRECSDVINKMIK